MVKKSNTNAKMHYSGKVVQAQGLMNQGFGGKIQENIEKDYQGGRQKQEERGAGYSVTGRL